MRRGVLIIAVVLAALLPAAAAASPGDLDEMFGQGGLVHTSDEGQPIAAGPDGRTFYIANALAHPQIVALKRNGEVDESFGRKGRVDIGSYGFFFNLLTTSDGKIVVAGSPPGTEAGIVAVRFTADGDVDPSFGGDGVVKLDHPNGISYAVLDPQGRLVMASGTSDGHEERLFLIRLTPDGGLDQSYGEGGFSESTIGGNALPAVGPDGSASVTLIDFGTTKMARFTPSGQLDPNFGDGGVVNLDQLVGGSSFSRGALAVDAEGRTTFIKAVTRLWIDTPVTQTILRLTASGEVDPTFDATPALASVGPGGTPVQPSDLMLDGQGRVLVSGGYGVLVPISDTPRTETYPLIARLLPDGSADPSFGEGGISAFPQSYNDLDAPYFDGLTSTDDEHVAVAGKNVIARFEVGAGPSDADGDYAKDRKDGCPRRFSERRGGCNRLPVRLSIKSEGQSVGGRVKADSLCLGRGRSKPARVRVMAISNEKPKRLGTAVVDEKGSWEYRLSSRHAEVFAEYPQHRRLDIAVCGKAGSRRVSP